jgi:predicted RNA binding protein with dsRBD fold (UPF0201 family)
MDKITLHIEALVNPTESEQKVRQAIENIFGPLQIQAELGGGKEILMAVGDGLEPLTRLRDLLRRERIRDAARKVLFEGVETDTVSFCLNKQVASVGHISFCKESSESPLGPIMVKVECENPREVVLWLTAKNI